MDLSIVPQVIQESIKGGTRAAVGLGSMGIVPNSTTLSKAGNLVMDRGGPGAKLRDEWRNEDTVNKALDVADLALTVVPVGASSKGLAMAGRKAAKGAAKVAQGAKNVIQTKKHIASTKPMEEMLFAQQRIPHLVARAEATRDMNIAKMLRSPRNARRKKRRDVSHLSEAQQKNQKINDLATQLFAKATYKGNKQKKKLAEGRLKGIDEAERIVKLIDDRMISSAKKFNSKRKQGIDMMKAAGIDAGKVLTKATTQIGPAYAASSEARKRWNQMKKKRRS